MGESDIGDRTRLYHKHLEKMSLGRYRVSRRDVCRRPSGTLEPGTGNQESEGDD